MIHIENISIHIHPAPQPSLPSFGAALLHAIMEKGVENESGTAAEPQGIPAGRPAIGQYWPGQGGIYIGSRLIDGEVHHVVIPGGIEHDAKDIKFDDVPGSIMKEINGHEDWRAPDQEDLMLAWINAREHFAQEGSDSIYWSRSERSKHWAWAVDFDAGHAVGIDRSYKFRVRPFRRFIYPVAPTQI